MERFRLLAAALVLALAACAQATKRDEGAGASKAPVAPADPSLGAITPTTTAESDFAVVESALLQIDDELAGADEGLKIDAETDVAE